MHPKTTVLTLLSLLTGCVDFGEPVSQVPLSTDSGGTAPGDGGTGGDTAGDGGSGLDDTGTPVSQEHVVTMLNNAFDPPELTIGVGDTVTWVNEDTWFHIVASGTPEDVTHEWISPTLDHGESWSLAFDEVGETLYYCWNHAAIMRDAVVIVEAR